MKSFCIVVLVSIVSSVLGITILLPKGAEKNQRSSILFGPAFIFSRALIPINPAFRIETKDFDQNQFPDSSMNIQQVKKIEFQEDGTYNDSKLSCPPIIDTGNICAHTCQSHNDCKNLGRKCCFNGCGRECMDAIQIVPIPPIPVPTFCVGSFSNPSSVCEDSCKTDDECSMDDNCCINQCGSHVCTRPTY